MTDMSEDYYRRKAEHAAEMWPYLDWVAVVVLLLVVLAGILG